jgi:hypothetical protein
MRRVTKVKITFYISEWWESSGMERVVGSGGADSILIFQLKRGGNGTKYCRKLNRRQRAHLSSIGKKHDRMMTLARGEVPPGRGKGGDDTSQAKVNLTEPKNKKKFTRSIQQIQMNGEELKQRLVNLIFFKTYACEILFCSSYRAEHNDKNRI